MKNRNRYDVMIWEGKNVPGRLYTVVGNVTSKKVRELTKKHGLTSVAVRRRTNGGVRPVSKLTLARLVYGAVGVRPRAKLIRSRLQKKVTRG